MRPISITSDSMYATLRAGDYVIVNRLARAFRLPFLKHKTWNPFSIRRGDIILFRFPSEDPDKEVCGEKPYGKNFIKRVIALPGEELEIKHNAVFIGNKRLETLASGGRLGPLRVSANSYFVMGDNRSRSCDSRVWGSVPASHIRGKAWFILWPPDRISGRLDPRA